MVFIDSRYAPFNFIASFRFYHGAAATLICASRTRSVMRIKNAFAGGAGAKLEEL
jgi:hypothetical protein